MVSPAAKNPRANAAAAAAAAKAAQAINTPAPTKKTERPAKPQPATSAHGWVKPAAAGKPKKSTAPAGDATALKDLAKSLNGINASRVAEQGLAVAMARVPPRAQKVVQAFLKEIDAAKTGPRGSMTNNEFEAAMDKFYEGFHTGNLKADSTDVTTVISYALLTAASKGSTFAAQVAPWYSAYSSGTDAAPRLNANQVIELFTP